MESIVKWAFCGTVLTIALAKDAVSEIKLPPARCNESTFTPCICAKRVPKSIRYRPTLHACNGRAAAILEGDFRTSFSVVLRDRENRDRFPTNGWNGCTSAEIEAGLTRCSAYKAQKVIRRANRTIHCFGEPGTSSVLSRATRITIKLRDIPESTNDPLVRVCLNRFNPTRRLN